MLHNGAGESGALGKEVFGENDIGGGPWPKLGFIPSPRVLRANLKQNDLIAVICELNDHRTTEGALYTPQKTPCSAIMGKYGSLPR